METVQANYFFKLSDKLDQPRFLQPHQNFIQIRSSKTRSLLGFELSSLPQRTQNVPGHRRFQSSLYLLWDALSAPTNCGKNRNLDAELWQWIYLLICSQRVLKFLKLQRKKHVWGPVSSLQGFIFKY